MKRLSWIFMAVLGLILLAGCEKDDIINNLVDNIELTDQQQMDLVAASLADASGGAVTAMRFAALAADSGFYTLSKLDTSLSAGWLNVDIEISFYTPNGTELPVFIPGVTDSLVCNLHLTGDTTYSSGASGSDWSLSLNSRANLQVKLVNSDTSRIGGAIADSSHYVHNGTANNIEVDSRSTLTITRVVVPISGDDHLPASGNLAGAVAGTISSGELSKDISIPYTVVFIGNGQAVVTLTDSGVQFTVDLRTGQILR